MSLLYTGEFLKVLLVVFSCWCVHKGDNIMGGSGRIEEELLSYQVLTSISSHRSPRDEEPPSQGSR